MRFSPAEFNAPATGLIESDLGARSFTIGGSAAHAAQVSIDRRVSPAEGVCEAASGLIESELALAASEPAPIRPSPPRPVRPSVALPVENAV